MALTIFLARLFGLYCIAISTSMLLRRGETIATINAMVDDAGNMLIAGIIAFTGGVAIIISHNLWQGGWLAIAITCIGWVMAGKGVALLFMPSAIFKKYYKLLHYEQFFVAYMSVTLVLGLALLWGSLG